MTLRTIGVNLVLYEFNVGPETGQIGQPFFLCTLIVITLLWVP